MGTRLVWRKIGREDSTPRRGVGFAPWVRELKGKSGVYFIRVPGRTRLEYVGESHTGRLYDTFTRHFQRWSTTKGAEYRRWYLARVGRGVGPTWDRNEVEAAVILTSPSVAVEVQDRFIERFDPTFNWKAVPEGHDPLSQFLFASEKAKEEESLPPAPF